MNRIAEFEKVSFEIFKAAVDENPRFKGQYSAYEDIVLPERATAGSAGYDLIMPFDTVLKTGETALIPTGLRARIDSGWVLMIFPRSGLGFKYRLRLDNTIGIIDSDYYGSSNEGHIMVKLTNEGGKDCELQKGSGFAQGVFLPFGITVNDCADGIRDGGFGSTSK